MKTIRVHDAVYEIKGENLEMVEELDLSDKAIRTRLLKRWTLEEACQVPKGLKRSDLKYIKYAKSFVEDTSKATTDYREEKLRRVKPHLYDGTPQPPYPMGDWRKHLGENDIYPKVVR